MAWVGRINKNYLWIKLHYLFFMAAMGPILPFLPVYAKQMGISSLMMGIITFILPILYTIFKPLFGFVADYFWNLRKIVFLFVLISGSIAFALIGFLPIPPTISKSDLTDTLLSHSSIFCNKFQPCNVQKHIDNCNDIKYRANITCHWISDNNLENNYSILAILKDQNHNNSITLLCLNYDNDSIIEKFDSKSNFICNRNEITKYTNLSCILNDLHNMENEYCLYKTYKFWIFILLMSIGSISFNVINSISDAICFDVLGEGAEMKYGNQRVYGTIGFGVGALIAGFAVDAYSHNDIKSFTPVFILVIIFSSCDVISCRNIQLPQMSGSKTIVKDILKLLKKKTIAIFLTYSIIAGIIDSFLIYFLFWYLEDLATQTGYKNEIKSIEGITVASQTLGGELIIFLFSGKIIKRLGYGYTFSLCFMCYSIRLISISLAPNPWWIVLIELFSQGPTYALTYTVIVSLASEIALPGTSATMQGIAAGMDDGLGFALGSLLSGVLYHKFGGIVTFRIFSAIAAIASMSYLILYLTILKKDMPNPKNNKKKCYDKNIERNNPDDPMLELQRT